MRIAYELVRQGWRDVFNALLYATGKRMEIRMVTLDEKFRRFPREHGHDHEILVSHGEVEELKQD